MPKHSISIGGFVVELTGDSPVLGHVAEELAPLRVFAADRAAHACLEITSRPAEEPPLDATIVGDVAAVPGRGWIKARATNWVVAFDLRGDIPHTTVHVPAGHTGPVAELAHRVQNRSFLSSPEQDGYLVVHFIVELLVMMFARDVALVHSSAVCRDGAALMLVSTGGTGKTSGATELIARNGWSFLSDDIVPLTAEGEVVGWPRRLMIYPYNLVEAPIYRDRVFQGTSLLDRAHWRLARVVRGPKGPRRRVLAGAAVRPRGLRRAVAAAVGGLPVALARRGLPALARRQRHARAPHAPHPRDGVRRAVPLARRVGRHRPRPDDAVRAAQTASASSSSARSTAPITAGSCGSRGRRRRARSRSSSSRWCAAAASCRP